MIEKSRRELGITKMCLYLKLHQINNHLTLEKNEQ
jgi:hypothetical protein